MTSSRLFGIQTPNEIKSFEINDLIGLADEIRQKIIEVMSVNGGHLGSNLGAIELTLALHKVFNSPLDKFIWDVSHQTYTHKLITGRKEQFQTIRKYKGLCGFSHCLESPYDHFHAGHAGTALSLGLGVAKTRDLEGGNEHVIPIIGDATLTNGMTLEALNNVHRDLNRFIIVLNDNNMSISKNVGAITHILSRLLSNPTSNKLYHEIESIVGKIPGYGAKLSKQGQKLTESLKNLVSCAAFFEQYGLSYVGPFDGHDIKKMIDVFEGLKDTKWPVIVHVMTQKGRGMTEAINNPISYHGARPFAIDTGKFLQTVAAQPTFPKVFGKHILEMAKKDESIIAITPAMSAGSCLDEFMKIYPDRCQDVGIAEAHAVTYCGGLAYGGKNKVVCSIYSTFLQRAFDNVFHDVCLQRLPVVFAIDRAGISGPDGSTHHGIYDIGFLNAMPNMIIAQPRNGQVLKELLESAFGYGKPTAIRYPNLATDEGNEPLKHREAGIGEILAEGKQILIIPLGHMCDTALKVREKLMESEISATVYDPVFVKPLDSEKLRELVLNHQMVVTIEEHSKAVGLGSIINNFLMTNNLGQIQVLNFGIPELFVEHGSHQELLAEIGLTPSAITAQIQQHFEKSEDLENLNVSLATN